MLIFKEAENIFRIETNNGHDISKIDLKYLVSIVLKNSFVVSLFQKLIGSDELFQIEDVLSSMIELFLRVRAFSLAKDITYKYKREIKLKKAKGSLRSGMKYSKDK